MLHEYREEISTLKTENRHFARIFDKHNALDDRIDNIESGKEHMDQIELEKLKKEKLKLKDEVYAMILDHKKNS